MAKVLQLFTRGWSRPLSFLDAAALLAPALTLALLVLLVPFAASFLSLAALAGAGWVLFTRKGAEEGGGRGASVFWLTTMAMTAIVPWLTSDPEDDLVWHPLFAVLYLGPLAFSAIQMFRALRRSIAEHLRGRVANE
jgi:hypothetical protein